MAVSNVLNMFFSAFFWLFSTEKTATKILFNLWDTPRGAATECPLPLLPPSLSLTPINLIEFLAQFLKVFFGEHFLGDLSIGFSFRASDASVKFGVRGAGECG